MPGPLQIVRRHAGLLGNAREHPGADLIPVMEGPDEVRPVGPGKGDVTARLSLHRPAEPQESGEDAFGLRGASSAHAAANVTVRNSGTASPRSRRSARTRRARAWTLAMASVSVVP